MAKRQKLTKKQALGSAGAATRKARHSTALDPWSEKTIRSLTAAADVLLGYTGGRHQAGQQDRCPEHEILAGDFLDQVSDDPLASARYARNRRTKKPSWRVAL